MQGDDCFDHFLLEGSKLKLRRKISFDVLQHLQIALEGKYIGTGCLA
jgi:hypothetical protein